ncbi:hypothetical protein [Pedobacter gandavensis]|uniref:DUF4292 domain-containing protein n=1 Tax=Pedobacter gandavensis TaxID=2679963 RepID=A0ABR6EY15_9SPHI|nr:hypothetical protein [Pedobacter gandavensis]MBB2150173.1 hypothetical protein [Pedobacter gandavensis]
MSKKLIYILLAVVSVFLSCNSESNEERRNKTRELSFDTIKGIKYHEVKRRFSTGLSFNEMGFQQEPSWIIQFKSNDSIMAYSPQKKRMQTFFLQYDHGDVYNFAKEWFRIKKISKDSLQMQRLQVNKKEIAKDIRSDVNITYYSDDYIKNVLKTTPENLQKPSKADTLYIQKLAKASNQKPADLKLAFAGRQPVVFQPMSDMIRVKKLEVVDRINGKTEAYDYLFPKYRIDISRAYEDFGYEFSALVDAKGKMYLGNFRTSDPENYEPRKKTLEAIIHVYLQNLLKIQPGTTLGIPHSSEINLIVVGKK